MNLIIYAFGKIKKGEPEDILCEDYLFRANQIGKNLGFAKIEIIEAVSKSVDENDDAVLAKLGNDGFLIILDETGSDYTSIKFAKNLEKLRDSGTKTVLLAIGGADGHGQKLKNKANLSIKFGSFTWPHKMVRFMLCEQIYRALSILANTPYHRA